MGESKGILDILKRILWLISCLCLGGYSGLVAAEAQLFLPQKGFTIPGVFEGVSADRSVSSVFQNSAGLALVSDTQMTFYSSQHFLGFNEFSVAVATPLLGGGLGVGVVGFGVDDLVRSEKNGSERGRSVGRFGYSNQVYNLAYGHSLSDEWLVGGNFSYFYQTLDTARAQGMALDAGVRYMPEAYWVEVYTQNALSDGLHWDDTGTVEALPARFVVSGGTRWGSVDLMASTNFSFHRFFGEWALADHLAVNGDVVFDDGGMLLRYSLSAIFRVNQLAFQYRYLAFVDEDFGMGENALGVVITL